jgi:hypothetical protein
VLRGGGFGQAPWRVSVRDGNYPLLRLNFIGFRAALPVEAVKQAIQDRAARPADSPTGAAAVPPAAPPPAIAPFDAKKANVP